mmetsp:Transcript_57203/g.163018  ORF Transcript_57203/g.163018 Transcript_57203/m.163018 type:complete len:981 (-) Transcript_57203:210-3152(-)
MNVIGNVINQVVGIEDEDEDAVPLSLKEPTYTVVIPKKNGVLGMAYRALDKESGGIIVTGIMVNSSVQDWNCTCEGDQLICVGDKMVSVNGQTDPHGMVQALQSSDIVTIDFLKHGPRWHVTGVTADCMEKISLAMDRGMSLKEAHARGREEEAPQITSSLSKLQLLMIIGASLAPNLFLLAALSDIGLGTTTYSNLASYNVDLMGKGIGFMSVLFAISLVVVDWYYWKNKVQKRITIIVCCYGFLIGGFLMARNYPELPLVITMMHVPVLLGALRATALKAVRRPSFYGSVGACLLAISLFSMSLWLVWMNLLPTTHRWDSATKADLRERTSKIYSAWNVTVSNHEFTMYADWYCPEEGDPSLYTLDEDHYRETGEMQAKETDCGWDTCEIQPLEAFEIKKACAKVKTTWLLIWMAPLVSFGTNFLYCLFCAINGSWLKVTDLRQLEKALKNFILIIVFAAAGGYVSVSVAGASTRLTGAMLSFLGGAIILLVIWMYLEIGERALTAMLKNSAIMQRILGLATSDWARAVIIVPVYPNIPWLLAVNFLNQRARRLRDPKHTQNTWFTTGANMVFRALDHWRWVSIFTKTNLLAMLYFTLAQGAGKFCIVLLSALNEYLQKNLGFEESCLIFFIVGFMMFMLPPVPGIPVYICGGIIVCAQARPVEGIGFYGGLLIAVVMCTILKLVAACGQYMIGYTMGWSVKVQQLVGVDKVQIKAIEMILKTKGLNAPKVAVLLGGPDWPTSVLCGILRVNIPQMLIGTLPIVFLCSPSILYGAFLITPITDENDKEGRALWNTLSGMMLMAAGFSQLVAMCLALYFLQDKAFRHYEYLAQPRPEHAKIIELTQSEAAYNDAYDRVTHWRRLPLWLKIMIQVAVSCMILQGMVLTLAGSLCFRPFGVNNKISDPWDKDGLNGDVMSFILPLGRLAMLLFTSGCVLHVIFVKITGRMAERLLRNEQGANNEGPPRVDDPLPTKAPAET